MILKANSFYFQGLSAGFFKNFKKICPKPDFQANYSLSKKQAIEIVEKTEGLI